MIGALLNDNFVWEPLVSHLRGSKISPQQFVNVNCPMCMSRGESADKRFRCGVKRDASGIGIHCFNCGFKARYRVGTRLSNDMRDFLLQLGIARIDVDRINFTAFTLRNIFHQSGNQSGEPSERSITYSGPVLPHPLPAKAKTIKAWADEGCDDPDFINVCEYLLSRGDDIFRATTYYWTPERTRSLNNRVIIPIYDLGTMIGWTARATRDLNPRYLSDYPPDIMLNTHTVYDPARKIILMVEGVFDALGLDCLGLLGSRLNERQISWLNEQNKRKIVLPDFDNAGKKLVDIALEQGWEVAFPKLNLNGRWWDADARDAADAVKRHGRLWTLNSVLKTSTNSEIAIRQRMKIAVSTSTR